MQPRLVIKYGSASVTDDQGMDVYRLAHHAAEIATQAERYQVVVVSSGSVAAGRGQWRRLGHRHGWPDMQTLAMLGSAETARAWQRALGEHGLSASQLLVTHRELDAIDGQASLGRALQANMAHGVIPVINENDAVSERELAELAYGGDNDGLGAHIATAIQADCLLLLTEAPAVLDATGQRVAEIAPVESEQQAVLQLANGGNAKGRGGMTSKITAAIQAAGAGVRSYIGSADDDMSAIIAGVKGSYFIPANRPDRVE